MRISDWSSDVCSSDLQRRSRGSGERFDQLVHRRGQAEQQDATAFGIALAHRRLDMAPRGGIALGLELPPIGPDADCVEAVDGARDRPRIRRHPRSEEHTSELQSLMRISYAVFCLKKKTNKNDR